MGFVHVVFAALVSLLHELFVFTSSGDLFLVLREIVVVITTVLVVDVQNLNLIWFAEEVEIHFLIF